MRIRYQYTFAFLWALILIACASITTAKLIKGSYFDSSILNLLPTDEQKPKVEAASKSISSHFSNKILLLIGSKDATDAELRHTIDKLLPILTRSNQFINVSTGINNNLQEQLLDFYRPYRYQLLSAPDRQLLQQSQLSQLRNLAIANLYSPIHTPNTASITEDPFQLLDHWLQNLQNWNSLKVDTWGLFAKQSGHQYRFITADFTGKVFDPDNQGRLIHITDMLQKQLNMISSETGKNYSLHKSGLLFHAASATKQAQNEISSIGLGSIAGILILLLGHFRAKTALIAPFLSISAGLLVAFTLTLSIFGEIHLITIAFGAGLVGVSIDYALHYLCAQRYKGNRTIIYILPGITLGLVTSISAYITQALTPFPGLQQMAIFSAAGLIGAWLTVACWFPLLPALKKDSIQLVKFVQLLAKHIRWPAAIAISLILLGLLGLPSLTFKDDLRSLQSSPQELIADEKLIQTLSQRPSASLFLLVEAPTEEELLQAEERIRESLDILVNKQELHGYLALSQFVPSISRQKQNLQLIDQNIYTRKNILNDFFSAIGGGQQQIFNAQSFFSEPKEWLTLSDLQRLPLYNTLSYLKQSNPSNSTATIQHSSIISLGKLETPETYNQIKQWTSKIPGIQLVDRVDNISSLLARYRHTVMLWMLMAYCGIAILLTWRYRTAAWRILLPPFAATAITFCLLSLSGQPINLFHLLASLLILGIGLDMGIFLNESNSETHSWEAITLSAMTSILAFGLLALSDTPVLHYFGITVLLGISIAWLLVFLIGAQALHLSSPNKSIEGSR